MKRAWISLGGGKIKLDVQTYHVYCLVFPLLCPQKPVAAAGLSCEAVSKLFMISPLFVRVLSGFCQGFVLISPAFVSVAANQRGAACLSLLLVLMTFWLTNCQLDSSFWTVEILGHSPEAN